VAVGPWGGFGGGARSAAAGVPWQLFFVGGFALEGVRDAIDGTGVGRRNVQQVLHKEKAGDLHRHCPLLPDAGATTPAIYIQKRVGAVVVFGIGRPSSSLGPT